jgi:hypothetical protein
MEAPGRPRCSGIGRYSSIWIGPSAKGDMNDSVTMNISLPKPVMQRRSEIVGRVANSLLRAQQHRAIKSVHQ